MQHQETNGGAPALPAAVILPFVRPSAPAAEPIGVSKSPELALAVAIFTVLSPEQKADALWGLWQLKDRGSPEGAAIYDLLSAGRA